MENKAETPTTTTDKSQTTTDSPSTTTDPKCDETTESSPCDSSDDGLEHMLVCTESVDTPASTNNMDDTPASSNNIDETVAPSNNMDETPAPLNNMDDTPAPSNSMDASAPAASTMDATAVSSAENESLGTDENKVVNNESSPQPPATPEEDTEIKTGLFLTIFYLVCINRFRLKICTFSSTYHFKTGGKFRAFQQYLYVVYYLLVKLSQVETIFLDAYVNHNFQVTRKK